MIIHGMNEKVAWRRHVWKGYEIHPMIISRGLDAPIMINITISRSQKPKQPFTAIVVRKSETPSWLLVRLQPTRWPGLVTQPSAFAAHPEGNGIDKPSIPTSVARLYRQSHYHQPSGPKLWNSSQSQSVAKVMGHWVNTRRQRRLVSATLSHNVSRECCIVGTRRIIAGLDAVRMSRLSVGKWEDSAAVGSVS